MERNEFDFRSLSVCLRFVGRVDVESTDDFVWLLKIENKRRTDLNRHSPVTQYAYGGVITSIAFILAVAINKATNEILS